LSSHLDWSVAKMLYSWNYYYPPFRCAGKFAIPLAFAIWGSYVEQRRLGKTILLVALNCLSITAWFNTVIMLCLGTICGFEAIYII
jgi:hypothetical protein